MLFDLFFFCYGVSQHIEDLKIFSILRSSWWRLLSQHVSQDVRKDNRILKSQILQNIHNLSCLQICLLAISIFSSRIFTVSNSHRSLQMQKFWRLLFNFFNPIQCLADIFHEMRACLLTLIWNKYKTKILNRPLK